MSTNNKISSLINSQVPFFVRNDHQTFVAFLEAYYEYLEQSNTTVQFGKTTERAKNFLNYIDIDKTLDDFTEKLYLQFLNIPIDAVADKKLLMKHVQDLYRAKGTEKSYRFLMRALFGEEIDFYYPKDDILRASDGKWYIQKTIRVTDTKIENVANNNISGLEQFIGTRVSGASSNASAVIESIARLYDLGVQVDELTLSSIKGTFDSGENVSSTFIDENGALKSITAKILDGSINRIKITNPGSRYLVGDNIPVIGDGTGANVTVASVSEGNVKYISVIYGGAGFQANDYLSITGGEGTGANAKVNTVILDSRIHPTSYNIVTTTITAISGQQLSIANYGSYAGFVNPSNANTTLINSLSFFTYANTGPAKTIKVLVRGSGYGNAPSAVINANTLVQNLGILGRIDVISPGTGYSNSDYIQFTNVFGGYGSGANANVVVNATGSIMRTNWLPVQGQIIGGSGYDQSYLPTANIITSTGTGGIVSVSSVLGYGTNLVTTNTAIGMIEALNIIDDGVGYTYNPTLDFTANGNGLATAIARVIPGTYTYPGRYLNDDGQLSSYNFLQDRDYYQNFSYVIRVKKSIDEYRENIKQFLHPSGMKLFGEYLLVDETATQNSSNVLSSTVSVL